MDLADFQAFVLPLVILVFLLAPLVFFYARREERQRRRLARLVGSFVRSRLKQEKMFAEELENLEALLQEKLINKATYLQLRELLERDMEQQRQQAHRNLKIPENFS